MDTTQQSTPGIAELLDKLDGLDANKIKQAAEAEERALIKTIEPEPELLTPMVPDFEADKLNMSAAGFPVTFEMLFEAYMDGEPIYLAGNTGGGKTTISEALCDKANEATYEANRKTLAENLKKLKAGTPAEDLGGYQPLKYHFRAMQGHEETRSAEMVGEPGLVFDGDGTRRVEAVLGAALEAAVEGYTLLVDEGDSIAPGVYAQCHGLFDRRVRQMSFWLNGRKDFVKSDDFRVIFTGNTKGEDENHLEFAHSQAQSKALMNRMAYVVDVDYMKPDAEISLLRKRIPDVDKWIVERMVKCATNVRKLYKQGSISIVISTRDIEAWGRNIDRAIRTGASVNDNQTFWTDVCVPAAGPTVLNKTSDTASAQAAAREFSWR